MGRHPKHLAIGASVLLAVGVAIAGWRMLALQQTALEARGHLVAARATLGDVGVFLSPTPEAATPSLGGSQLTSACTEVTAASDTLQDVNGQLATLMPLVGALESVPMLGAQARNQTATLQAGTQVAAAGASLCEGLGPLTTLLSGSETSAGPGSASDLLRTLVAARPKLVAATQRLQQLQVSLDQIQLDDLESSNRTGVVAVRQRIPQVLTTLHDATVLLDLMGSQRVRRYLLVSENPDELRGTGGYIGSAGIVEADAGSVRLVEYGSSRRYDTPADLRAVPPAAFQTYLGSSFWELAGANWWTSFPDVARQLSYFFSLSRPEKPVDGVIALDQFGLQRLLEVVGPVDVPDYGERVSAADAESKLNQYVHVDADESSRKQFTAALSTAVLQAVLHAPPSALPGLVRAARASLEQQHLLVWIADAGPAQLFAEKRWDGSVLPAPGDSLLLVDANVANNKNSQAVTRDVTYAVSLSDSDHPRATLSVSYTNQANVAYRTFLRVLVPPGSILSTSDGFVTPATEDEECGRRVFAGEVLIPGGATAQVTLVYQLPPSIHATGYDLLVQQQAGVPPGHVSVAVSTTAGAVARTDLANAPGQHAHWHLDSGGLQPSPLPAAQVGGCGQSLVEARPIAAPASIQVPGAHIESPVVDLGVGDDGEMEAPPNPDVVGWYRMSARPGQPGNSVMSGHVDWGHNAAVFWGLRNLRTGDPIQIRGADGSMHTYTVEWNRTFASKAAPVDQIVGPTRDAVLTLITCDGVFDPHARAYADRRVVRARLVE